MLSIERSVQTTCIHLSVADVEIVRRHPLVGLVRVVRWSVIGREAMPPKRFLIELIMIEKPFFKKHFPSLLASHN
ncbi:unnamed protein product [Toxocara canis]|uniref:Uncharacterized protein n=1 Tax=Toxocara canis TaxID=6265 RepID=A0A183U9F5_TOXCA|nr:unnamed protein product [Toxocara canis]